MRSPTLLLALAFAACGTGPADDSSVDGDADTDSDADAAWACAPEAAWGCPEASVYVGDSSWSGMARATAEACWCSSFSEERTLEEELSTKARFRVVEGSWPLPVEAGTWDLTLPTCNLRAGGPGPRLAGVGRVTAQPGGGGADLDHVQPLADGWSLEAAAWLLGKDEPAELLLDGRLHVVGPESAASFFLVPPGAERWETAASTFAPCLPADPDRNTHVVVFEGGEVTLVLLVGHTKGGTEPAAFVHAEGTLDGVAFAQDDYFRLVYNPEQHHFSRDFAVLFDAPIGEACALRVEAVDPWQEDPPATVRTARCDLVPIEDRPVTSETLAVGLEEGGQATARRAWTELDLMPWQPESCPAAGPLSDRTRFAGAATGVRSAFRAPGVIDLPFMTS